MMNKNNVPYYIAGTLAALTLLASGVFAVAPYIGFLAPVAALSVGLPFIVGCAVFSAVTIALSYKAISKNKTISEKDTQLADEKSKVEAKDKTISEKDTQLADEKSKVEVKDSEISELKKQLGEQKAKEKEISKKESEEREIVEGSSVSRLARAAVVGATATGGIAGVAVLGGIAGGMVGCALGPVILGLYVDKSIVFTTKKKDEVYESAKGTISSVGNKLKNVYDTMPSTESVKSALNSVRSSLYSRIYGTKVSSPEEQFNKDLNYSNVEASNLENHPTEEENGQGWFAWSLGKAKSVMTEVVVVGADVTKPYFAKITKALAPNLDMVSV